MFPLQTCDTCYNPIFYDKYDGNNFILIWHNQDGLECREGRPGGVQQDKLVPQYGGMGARFARGFAHPLPNHSLTGYGGLLRQPAGHQILLCLHFSIGQIGRLRQQAGHKIFLCLHFSIGQSRRLRQQAGHQIFLCLHFPIGQSRRLRQQAGHQIFLCLHFSIGQIGRLRQPGGRANNRRLRQPIGQIFLYLYFSTRPFYVSLLNQAKVGDFGSPLDRSSYVFTS